MIGFREDGPLPCRSERNVYSLRFGPAQFGLVFNELIVDDAMT
jgi:hypothetical protein